MRRNVNHFHGGSHGVDHQEPGGKDGFPVDKTGPAKKIRHNLGSEDRPREGAADAC